MVGHKRGVESNGFDPKTRIFTRYQNDPNDNESLFGSRVFDISDDGEFLWVATDGGLNRLNRRTGKFTRYINSPTDTTSISNNVVITLVNDENYIWTGTWNNGGINRMDRATGKFKHYLAGISVNQLYKDLTDVMWAITTNGLYRYNRKEDEFNRLTEENTGLAMEGLNTVVADNDNNLWFASISGIYRLNKERNQEIPFGKKESGVSGEDTRYSWITKMADGRIYVPGFFGHYLFYPDKLNINSIAPRVYFSNFWLNNKEIRPGSDGPLHEPLFVAKEIDLPYNQNVFSISFTSVDYSNSVEKRIY